MARPAWPPPMTTVSTLSITDRYRLRRIDPQAISSRLLRLEPGRASRVTPIDELLLKESTQLSGRRAAGLESLLFKLSAYLRALQDDVHLAREPLDDFLWRLRRCEQPCPNNNGKLRHSRFADRRHVRKQRAPFWEQRRECAKPTFLYQRNHQTPCVEHQVNACAQEIGNCRSVAFVRHAHHVHIFEGLQLSEGENGDKSARRVVELAGIGARVVD